MDVLCGKEDIHVNNKRFTIICFQQDFEHLIVLMFEFWAFCPKIKSEMQKMTVSFHKNSLHHTDWDMTCHYLGCACSVCI